MQTSVSIGLGGGCYWCTEALFSSLRGIHSVTPGWFASTPPDDSYSEGVLLEIDTRIISLSKILEIHIDTHSSQANHSKRDQYRSAVYTLNQHDQRSVTERIDLLSSGLNRKIVTRALPLVSFKPQPKQDYLDYYYKNPEKPFCQAYINPKLRKLLKTHGGYIKPSKLPVLNKQFSA